MAGRLPLVIDTDTASDDAVALLIAVRSGLADVRAVTTVAGNVGVQQGTRNALYTLEFCGAGSVPVYPGCDRPLLRPYRSAQEVHGADGMGDVGLPEPTVVAADEHAVDALRRVVREHPERSLTLVTLAPLTNIAAVLQLDHDFLQRFSHVYCMAGSADMIGNVSATAEYNVWADPEAAAVVLAHATADQVTLVGCDVSALDAVMTPEDQEALRGIGTPHAQFVNDINQVVAQWVAAELGLPGYDLPDPITMAAALDRSLITRSEQAHVTVALADENAGQLIVDRRRVAPAANVTLVNRVDSAGFKRMLFDSCR